MTQRVLMCTMHFGRKMRKWIGIPVKWNLELFLRPIFAPTGGGLKSLSCTRWNARKVYPQLLTHSTVGILMRRAPRPGRRVRVQKRLRSPTWETTRLPKYYDERAEREFETKARYPKITRGRSG
jgi:hypothetical protein